MFSTGILDTAIGLIFLYALLALVNSAVVELAIGYTNLRGENLQKVLETLLPAGSWRQRQTRNHSMTFSCLSA